MSAETKKETEVKISKLKVKVLSYTDYLAKAREICKVDGGDIFNKSIELLYSENEVIATVQKSGETRFVCKV